MILHGLIYLFGFVVPWKHIETVEMPYTTQARTKTAVTWMKIRRDWLTTEW